MLCLEWAIEKKRVLREVVWNKAKLLLLKNGRVSFASINYKENIGNGGAKKGLSKIQEVFFIEGLS